MLTAAQLQQLNTELETDPLTYGYSALIATGQHNLLADLLNKPRDGSDGEAAITMRRDDIAISDIYAAIDVADYTALGSNPTASQLSSERRFLAWLTGLGSMDRVRLVNDDGTDTPVVKNLKAMFQAATGTMQRLNLLTNRSGSRAESLFGRNTLVLTDEVSFALSLP